MSGTVGSSLPLPASSTSTGQKTSRSDHRAGDEQGRFMMVLAIGVSLMAVATIAFVLIILLIRRQKKKIHAAKREELARKPHKTPLPAFGTFRLKALREATCNFTTMIGKGGFGTVYKAYLTDGTIAAIKRMEKGRKGGDEEFRREVLMPGRLHHRHLVNLIGFCAEKGERMLVLEYMANGSLKEHLHGKCGLPLDWPKRMRIALGVAAGLEYLHSWSDPPVIHRDVKSSNVLLSETFVAKVSDFGLCKVAPAGSDVITCMMTDVMGTPGYMDPEYVSKHVLTEKSDVFSYGVVLLELITGRHAVQEWRSLVEWAQIFFLDKDKVPGMVDPALGDNYDLQELYVVVEMAQLCTLGEGSQRPSMKQVLNTLSERLLPNQTMYSESQNMHTTKTASVGTLSGTVTVSSLFDATSSQEQPKVPPGVPETLQEQPNVPAGVPETLQEQPNKVPAGVPETLQEQPKVPAGIAKTSQEQPKVPAGIAKTSQEQPNKVPAGITQTLEEQPNKVSQEQPNKVPAGITKTLEEQPNKVPAGIIKTLEEQPNKVPAGITKTSEEQPNKVPADISESAEALHCQEQPKVPAGISESAEALHCQEQRKVPAVVPVTVQEQSKVPAVVPVTSRPHEIAPIAPAPDKLASR